MLQKSDEKWCYGNSPALEFFSEGDLTHTNFQKLTPLYTHSQFKCAFGFKKMFLKSFLISLFQPYLPSESYL